MQQSSTNTNRSPCRPTVPVAAMDVGLHFPGGRLMSNAFQPLKLQWGTAFRKATRSRDRDRAEHIITCVSSECMEEVIAKKSALRQQ